MQRDTRSLQIFVLVGLALLYLWWMNHDYQKRYAEWARQHPEAAEQVERQRRGLPPIDATPSLAVPAPSPSPSPVAATAEPRIETKVADLAEAFARVPADKGETRQTIDTPRMRLSFSSRGGRLVSARLLDYPEIFPKKRFLEIYHQWRSGVPRAHIEGLLADAEAMQARLKSAPRRDRLDRADPSQYQLLADTGVELVAEGYRPLGLTLPGGQGDDGLPYDFSTTRDPEGRQVLSMIARLTGATVEKRLTFSPDGYEIGVLLRVETGGGVEMPEKPLGLRWEGGVGRVFPQESGRYDRVVYCIEGDHKELVVPSLAGKVRKLGGPLVVPGSVKWAGADGRYFMAAFLTISESNGAAFDVEHPSVSPDVERGDVALQLPFNDSPRNGAREQALRLYLGPKDYDHMVATNVGLQDSLYGGITGPICILMLWILNALHYIWPNYGVSILLLTLLMRLLMFPLVHKQTQAMRRMQKLQPLIKDIQERHKDNPQQAQKEQFELFRKHKVNPMSGCLPLLATMPIFIALWYTTQNTIGLRGEPFYFWIHDLSQPDTLFYLAFRVPFFGGLFDVNPLPLVGAILMVWQMAQTTMDPKQKPMLVMMPIMMLLITWRLPSGTNLYFMMSSFFQMGQQWLIKRIEKDEPVAVSAPGAVAPASQSESRERPAREKVRTGRTKARK